MMDINLSWEEFKALSKHERWIHYKEWRQQYSKSEIARKFGVNLRNIYTMFGADKKIVGTISYHSHRMTQNKRENTRKTAK